MQTVSSLKVFLLAEAAGGAREEGGGVGPEGGGAEGVALQREGQQLAPTAQLHAVPTLLLPRYQRGHSCRVPGDCQEALLSLVM